MSLCEVDQVFRRHRDVGVSALRVSLGMSSNEADVRTWIDFLGGLLDRRVDELDPPPPVPPPRPDGA